MEWFYNKSITIMRETDGYMYHGSWVDGTLQAVRTIACDVQPASRDQIYKDYGFYIECEYRLFCDIDKAFDVGAVIGYEGKNYKTVKVIKWDDYIEIFVLSAEVST